MSVIPLTPVYSFISKSGSSGTITHSDLHSDYQYGMIKRNEAFVANIDSNLSQLWYVIPCVFYCFLIITECIYILDFESKFDLIFHKI